MAENLGDYGYAGMKTTWTKRRPRKAGYYWVRRYPDEDPSIHYVHRGDVELFKNEFYFKDHDWSGPIEPPK